MDDNDWLKDHKGIAAKALRDIFAARDGEIAELASLVKEWACDSCSTVFTGPPQPGFSCVVCPKCGGNTAPHETVKHWRKMREKDAEIERLREALGAIAAIGYSDEHNSHDNAMNAYDMNCVALAALKGEA